MAQSITNRVHRLWDSITLALCLGIYLAIGIPYALCWLFWCYVILLLGGKQELDGHLRDLGL